MNQDKTTIGFNYVSMVTLVLQAALVQQVVQEVLEVLVPQETQGAQVVLVLVNAALQEAQVTLVPQGNAVPLETQVQQVTQVQLE